jgi:ABC-type dipeptide/oligopeptide/nickel transport system permease subunit
MRERNEAASRRVEDGLSRESSGQQSPRALDQSWSKIAARRLLRDKTSMASLVFLVFVGGVVAFPFLLAPYDPYEMSTAEALSPPSSAHWVGTDVYGRDLLSRVVFGAGPTLKVGVIAVAISATIGTVLGLVGGYWAGWTDEMIMRFMDILLAFPGILLALFVIAVLGPGLGNVTIAVGISYIPHFARLARGCVLTTKQELYVIAARAIGCGHRRIVVRHILPNFIAPLIVMATLDLAWAILSAASLSFLGLGVSPPTAEWGAMLSDGRDYLRLAPWLSTIPGLSIMTTILSINLLGDGLRTALDPRMKL